MQSDAGPTEAAAPRSAAAPEPSAAAAAAQTGSDLGFLQTRRGGACSFVSDVGDSAEMSRRP